MRIPSARVKFFSEFNVGSRVVSTEEEEKSSPKCSAVPIQDLIRFALNTGLRVGEIFTLRWSPWIEKILTVFAPKTGTTRTVPINSDTRKILELGAGQKE